MADFNTGTPRRPAIAGISAAAGSGTPATTNGAPQVQRKPAGQSKPAAPVHETKDSFREIVETVVFVVVLVLLLKSFVAEAFVIPTGSMAETLFGYQKEVVCDQCKRTFQVNCSVQVDPQGHMDPMPVVAGTCPNCFYHQKFDPGTVRSWNSGDRVLVAKFLYDLGLLNMDSPRRFQVVVFKFPETPQKDHVPLNYIKRLIGMPGETIAIYYGKLYYLEGNTQHQSDLEKSPLDLWKYTHRDDSKDLTRFESGEFRILRKPPQQCLSERRIVYNNDFQAKDMREKKVPPRWAAEPQDGTWTPDKPEEPRIFTHPVRPGANIDWLRYRHWVPTNWERDQVSRQLITDFMGYNTWETRDSNHRLPDQNWVGDLMLECNAEVTAPEGELVLELSKGVDRFHARWDLATGVCTLTRITGGREVVLDSKETSLKRTGTYRLRFANFDERLLVWVDSSLPFGEGVPYDAPSQRGPTEADLEPVSIGVRGGGVVVSNLQLYRDTYYTLAREGPDSGHRGVDYGNPADFVALRNLSATTLYVQPGHYLCLGDNSPESSDGRMWGLVPKRLLLGRAMAIYWPLGRAGRIE